MRQGHKFYAQEEFYALKSYRFIDDESNKKN